MDPADGQVVFDVLIDAVLACNGHGLEIPETKVKKRLRIGVMSLMAV